MTDKRPPYLDKIGHVCKPGCRPGAYHLLDLHGSSLPFSEDVLWDAPYLQEVGRRLMLRLRDTLGSAE